MMVGWRRYDGLKGAGVTTEYGMTAEVKPSDWERYFSARAAAGSWVRLTPGAGRPCTPARRRRAP